MFYSELKCLLSRLDHACGKIPICYVNEDSSWNSQPHRNGVRSRTELATPSGYCS